MQGYIREETQETIEGSLDSDSPVLVEAPPASGKTYNSVRLADIADSNITYLASRTDLYQQAIEEAKERGGISFATIPSPHRDCPTFKEENNGAADKAKRMYAKGVNGKQIHYLDGATVYTPCHTSNSPCPYISKFDKFGSPENLEDIDLLIGNHQHAYRQSYLEDRIAIFDEFNQDPFISRFPSDSVFNSYDRPEDIIPEFLGAVDDLPFDDLTDLIEARAKESDSYEEGIEWFEEHGAGRNVADEFLTLSPYEHDATHRSAPKLTLGVLLMERVGPGVELAYQPDIWEKVGLDAGLRCLRDRDTGKILVLRPPPALESAEQIIGLDALPTVRLWDTVFNCEFEVRRIIEREHLDTYLTEGMNFDLVQLAEGAHHYSGGSISNRDPERFKAVRIIENEPVPLITRKQALEKYRSASWFEDCIKTSEQDGGDGPEKRHYATVLSSNAFENESLGFVSGSPYPSDDVIRHWSGLCGESTEPIRPNNTLEGFTGFGQEVYEHFTHHQVFQAILRFGRDLPDDSKITTVYVNTQAVPEWLTAISELSVVTRESEEMTILILEELIRAALSDELISDQTAKTLKKRIAKRLESSETNIRQKSEPISKNHIRDTLNSEEFSEYINVRRDAGKHGADLFSWEGDGDLYDASGITNSDNILVTKSSIYFLNINF